jgi:hypothetical protein
MVEDTGLAEVVGVSTVFGVGVVASSLADSIAAGE